MGHPYSRRQLTQWSNTSQYLTILANSLTSVRKVKGLDGLLSVYADRRQLPVDIRLINFYYMVDYMRKSCYYLSLWSIGPIRKYYVIR
jgi:hypothetical protein